MMYARFPLSLHNVENPLHERGIDMVPSEENSLRGVWSSTSFRVWQNWTLSAISRHRPRSSAWPWWCMSGFRFHFAMLKICFMNAASISVTKQSDIGGINLVQCLRVRSVRTTSSSPESFQLAMASGWSFCQNQWRNTLPVACRRPRRRNAGSLCFQATRPQSSKGFP